MAQKGGNVENFQNCIPCLKAGRPTAFGSFAMIVIAPKPAKRRKGKPEFHLCNFLLRTPFK